MYCFFFASFRPSSKISLFSKESANPWFLVSSLFLSCWFIFCYKSHKFISSIFLIEKLTSWLLRVRAALSVLKCSRIDSFRYPLSLSYSLMQVPFLEACLEKNWVPILVLVLMGFLNLLPFFPGLWLPLALLELGFLSRLTDFSYWRGVYGSTF